MNELTVDYCWQLNKWTSNINFIQTEINTLMSINILMSLIVGSIGSLNWISLYKIIINPSIKHHRVNIFSCYNHWRKCMAHLSMLLNSNTVLFIKPFTISSTSHVTPIISAIFTTLLHLCHNTFHNYHQGQKTSLTSKADNKPWHDITCHQVV